MVIQVLKGVLQRYREARRVETARIGQLVAENANEIYHDSHSYVLGNPEGDVTLTELFDYR